MDPTKKYKLLLLLGQSNAIGTALSYTDLSGPYADYWRETEVRIAKMMSCYDDNDPTAVCSVEYAAHRVGRRKHPQGTFGPELGIARSIPNIISHVSDPGNIIIVKVATGGTNLDNDWDPDAVTGFMKYAKMLRFITSPRQLWADSFEVVGTSWIQGENDSRFTAMANSYAVNLPAFATRLRTDMSNPTMPIAVTQLHSDLDIVYGPHRDTIRAAQQASATADVRMTLVSHDGVALGPDDVHMTANGTCAHGLDVGAALDSYYEACA